MTEQCRLSLVRVRKKIECPDVAPRIGTNIMMVRRGDTHHGDSPAHKNYYLPSVSKKLEQQLNINVSFGDFILFKKRALSIYRRAL
jgi:hypothetical protein